MEPFELPAEHENIRQAVFPNLTPVAYAAMLITRKAQFASLSPECQATIRAAVDRMGDQLKAYQQRIERMEGSERSGNE